MHLSNIIDYYYLHCFKFNILWNVYIFSKNNAILNLYFLNYSELRLLYVISIDRFDYNNSKLRLYRNYFHKNLKKKGLSDWGSLLDPVRMPVQEVRMQIDGTWCQDFRQGCTCRLKPDSVIINYKYYFYKDAVLHM